MMGDESADLQALSRSLNELLVLGVLRGGEKHGYQIALDLAESSAGMFELQHGTLYPVLHRLEERGWILGRWDSDSGRRRKVYGLTREGERHLKGEAAHFETLARGILHLVRGPGHAPL
jgi:PadR family transcriptional regulator, regulatory protein PadR